MSGEIDKLLEEHRYINVENENWWEWIEDKFKERMQKIGVRVERIYFSGFYSQGDGACFTGSLVEVDRYLDLCHTWKYPMLRKLLEANGKLYVSCSKSGRYYHEYSTHFDVSCDTFADVIECFTNSYKEIIAAQDIELFKELEVFEDTLKRQWRKYMSELYSELKKEYEYLTSDDMVWSAIKEREE